MTVEARSRSFRGAVRIGAVAAMAAFAVLAPIRMAEGAPKTRFAVVPASVTGAPRVAAAAVRPEIPPAAGPVVQSPFPLSHLAVRWVGSEEAAVDIRLAGSDEGWGPWRALPVAHDLEDGAGGPILSELIRAHGATRAQVRASGDARDVEIVAIDTMHGPRTRKLATGTPARAAEDENPPADGGEDRGPSATPSSSSTTSTTKGTRSSSTTTTTGRPKPQAVQPPIVTRAEWGADESIRKNNQKYAPITKLFVHHTVTSPDGADPDPAATVRAIYAYHVQGNGWDDIGYNFLIDAEGRIYEGRWARDYQPGEKPTGEDLHHNGVVGAHVLNHNAGSAGVAVLGDFSGGEPTTAARDALVKLMAWKADRHDIDVLGKDPFQASDGVVSTFPNLAGHRDAGQTACPGDRLYPLLPDLRERVASLVTAAHGPTTGYWSATADGRVLAFGDAPALGSMAGIPLNGSIVGMAATTTGKGYWLLGSDGGVFSFGDAKFFGSTGNIKLNKPVVGMAPTPTGKGYWFVATDGGIFSFGDAKFHGSTGNIKLNQPVVRMAPTPSGKGYWLVASDGGIFAFGDAPFHGSTGGIKLNKPVVSMAPNPIGKGYWLVASDGGLFAFDVPYLGSVPAAKPENYPGAVQMRATATGKGYYIADANGGISVFGDARFLGADTSQRPPRAAVDLVLAP
ncbi:MAG: N-acetylmuramoyl-L-alanine amidase [Actinomycetota bacterium]|jgi:hypothetical protein